VGRLVAEARALARRVLVDERASLERVAAALLEHETLSSQQLDVLLAQRIVALRR
jgi:cell division protease FtsH